MEKGVAGGMAIKGGIEKEKRGAGGLQLIRGPGVG